MEPIIERCDPFYPSLSPGETVLRAIVRQFLDATDAYLSYEVFYRWLEFPEHADLRARWFEAAETIKTSETYPAFMDGDMEQWELFLGWVFNNALGEWKWERRLTR